MVKGRLAGTLIVIQALVIAGLALLLWQQHGGLHVAHDEDDAAAEHRTAAPGPAPIERPSAGAAVAMPLDVQHASGLRTAELKAASLGDGSEAFGEVMPTQGLAEARARLQQAQWDVRQLMPTQAHAQSESDRVDALWRDGGNIAARLVEQAHAELAQVNVHLESARSLAANGQLSVCAEWGTAVCAALQQPEGGALASVLAGRSRLLRIASGSLVAGQVSILGEPGAGVAVQRFGPAAQAGASGKAAWYWLGPTALQPGQRVRLEARAGRRDGVALPESAVVWQSGQAWVWLMDDAEHFHREAVRAEANAGGNWWAGPPLKPGQRVVVEGAQLLLSEESRALIRNENGD